MTSFDQVSTSHKPDPGYSRHRRSVVLFTWLVRGSKRLLPDNGQFQSQHLEVHDVSDAGSPWTNRNGRKARMQMLIRSQRKLGLRQMMPRVSGSPSGEVKLVSETS